MGIRLVVPALVLVTTGVAIGAVAQERMKPKGPADFATVHADIKKHFDAGHFGKAYSNAKTLVGLIGVQHGNAIRASLPDAPANYEKVPYKPPKNQAMQQNLLGALAPGVGNIFEQVYRGPNGQFTTTVTSKSPLIQMMRMVINNPAMLGDNQELIKYGEILAILETQGKRKTLKIMIDDSLIETAYPDQSEEFIFGMWDQDAVDTAANSIRQ